MNHKFALFNQAALCCTFLLAANIAFGQLSAWTYAVPVVITENSGAPAINYQALIQFDTQTPIAAGKMETDGADLRVGTDINGTSLLNFWIESGINTPTTNIWVKIPFIAANDSVTIYLFYGNPAALPLSNVDSVLDPYADGAIPGSPTSVSNCIPFGSGNGTYGTYKGFTYQNIDEFFIVQGSTVCFDLGGVNDYNISINLDVCKTDFNGSDSCDADGYYNVLQDKLAAVPQGNTICGDFELCFTVDSTYHFWGQGVKWRISPTSAFTADGTCTATLCSTDNTDLSGKFVRRFYYDETSWDNGSIGGFVVNGYTRNTTSNPEPSASIGMEIIMSGVSLADAQICNGDSVLLIVSIDTLSGLTPPFTYLWTPVTGLSCTTCDSTWASPSTTTVYQVVVTDSAGIQDSASATVTVANLAPTANAGNDTAICEGNTVTLNGSGGPAYTWSPAGSLSDSAIANPVASPLANTGYILAVDNGCGMDTDTVMVTVNPLPVVSSSDTSVCPGNSVQLLASGGATYSWSPGASLDDSTLANPVATPGVTTVYSVTATSAFGCSSFTSITVIVDSVSQLTATTSKDTICPNDSVQLTATTCTPLSDDFESGANGWAGNSLWHMETTQANSPTTSWTYNTGSPNYNFDTGTNQGLLTSPVIDLTGKAVGDTTLLNFFCFYETETTGTTYDQRWIQISANGGPFNNLIQLSGETMNAWHTHQLDLTSYNGDSIQIGFFFNTIDGAINNFWGWSIDDVELPCGGVDTNLTYAWTPATGLSNPNIYNPMASPDTTTTYVVSAAIGSCSSTDTITIYVDAGNSVSIVASSLDVCQGDSVTLSVIGTPGMPDTSTWTYSWTPGSSLSDSTASPTFAFPLTTTTYQLDVTNVCGTFSDTVTLTSKSAPTADAGLSTAFCYGGSVQLTGTGGVTYLWSPNQFLSCTACDKTNANPPADMTYYVTATDSFGCSATDSVFVEVNGQPVTAVSSKPFVCSPGDTTQLYALGNCGGGGQYITYSESFTTGLTYCPSDPQYDNWAVFRAQLDTNTQSYAKVTIMGSLDPIGRSCTDPVMVKQMAGSLKDGVTGDWIGCDGNSWHVGGTGSSCITGCGVLGDDVEFTADGSNCSCTSPGYIVRPCIGNSNWGGINGATCSAPTQTMTVIFELAACDTLDTTILFSWSPGGTLSDTTIYNPVASPTTTVSYVVTADDQGCVSTDTITIGIDTTVITASADTAICNGNSAILGVVSNTTVSSYLWSPATGLSSTTVQNPVAGPGSTTTYSVDVTNVAGCTYTDTVVLTIDTVPAASFLVTTTDLQAAFLNTTASATSYLWDFGDGFMATVTNPVHTYNNNGAYNVCLIATNYCGTDTTCSGVSVTLGGCNNTVAAFDTITVGLTGVFTDLSTDATGWSWDFGDGVTSLAQNPVHTYALGGTYNVCLVATNPCSSDTLCIAVTVASSGPPCTPTTASFTSNSVGLDAVFSDGSPNATSWSWDFGDGNNSASQNPVHTYGADGTYTVCLIASNACSSDTVCQSVVVSASSCTPTTAGFSASPSGLVVSFTDASTDPTAWSWDFGDGNTSTLQNPGNTYSAPGTYTVCLIVTNPCSADTSCTSITVTACSVPVASFFSSGSGLSVTFTDASTNSVSWSWNFGDGNNSNIQNPVYSYTNSGSYNVCLTASSGCASNVYCDSVTVTTCASVVAAFAYSDSGLTASFIDLSVNAGSWNWDFGDGFSSTAQNASHTYAGAGAYTVCLSASSACTSDSNCVAVTVGQVGVEETSGMEEMEVYPNPADGGITFTLPSGETGDMIFSIYNVLGERVFEAGKTDLPTKLSPEHTIQFTIELGSLSDGVYLLKVQSGDTLHVKQIVISR